MSSEELLMGFKLGLRVFLPGHISVRIRAEDLEGGGSEMPEGTQVCAHRCCAYAGQHMEGERV